MLKHVVMWKFKDEAEGNSKEFNMQYVIKKSFRFARRCT